MVPTSSADRKASAKKMQEDHLSWFLGSMVARMCLRIKSHRDFMVRTGASPTSDFIIMLFAIAINIAAGLAILCLAPRSKRPAIVKLLFRSAIVIESVRVLTICAVQGWSEGVIFVIESRMARQEPERLFTSVVALLVSLLHGASILDLPLKELATYVLWFMLRLSVVVFDQASRKTMMRLQVVSVTLIIATTISAYLLKPGVLRERRAAREQSIIVEEVAHFASARASRRDDVKDTVIQYVKQ